MKKFGLIQAIGGVVGLIIGYCAAQEIFLLVHPAYMAQWTVHWNGILTHQHLSFSAMIQRNVTEQLQTMRCYLIAGSLLGFSVGTIMSFIGKEWIRRRLAA